tara:strand:- start:2411 stop:2689 length:279 start_codon:yes stop_codon:yes gene_type:complete
MNKWILLKASRVESNDLYNVVEMKFVNNVDNKHNDYIVNFKINLEDDIPEKILEEFNQSIGYVDNICDFMTSIKLYIKRNPRWLSISFDKKI